jgi:hypothetical protein
LYFIISKAWIDEWHRTGGRNGRIDQSDILDLRTGLPYTGLKIGEDYDVLNSKQWEVLVTSYGVDFIIERSMPDIYFGLDRSKLPIRQFRTFLNIDQLKEEGMSMSSDAFGSSMVISMDGSHSPYSVKGFLNAPSLNVPGS